MADQSSIKNSLVTTSSEAIASYTGTELTTGKSFLSFYCTPVSVSGATTYTLNTQATTSEPKAQGYDTSQANWYQVFDRDFDITVNKPLIIEGTGILNWTYGCDSAGGKTTYMYIIARLIDYDGSTETEICNATSRTHTFNADDQDFRCGLNMTIPRTKLKSGHTLRLSVEWWIKGDDTDSFFFYNTTNSTQYDTSNTTAYPVNKPNWTPDEMDMVLQIPYIPKD